MDVRDVPTKEQVQAEARTEPERTEEEGESMSMYAMDAGSKYLVKAENLDDAYEWLEKNGEFAHRIGVHGDCVILSANGYEDMFCGDVCYGIGELIEEFLEQFCEPGSYACQRVDDFCQYDLYWKDGDGVHSEGREYANPFESQIAEIERSAR